MFPHAGQIDETNNFEIQKYGVERAKLKGGEEALAGRAHGRTAVEDYFSRVWNDLLGRIGGPLSLRLLLQPTMATIFAIRDGLKDARTGQPPYFYSLFTDPDHRRSMLREGWHAVAKVFILAIILDLVYQLIVFRWIYPLESLVVAFILALLPYLLLRGPVNRIARKFGKTEIEQSPGNR